MVKIFKKVSRNLIASFTYKYIRIGQLWIPLDQKVINKFIIIILSYKRAFVIIADSNFAALRLNSGSHYI